MKPTMPMNAFPPGGPPSGPPSNGGWGPPGGGPPGGPSGFPPPGPHSSGPGFPPQEPKKSKTGLIIGGGCGCLAILGCLISGVFGIPALLGSLGPGEEVASVPVTLGQPYAITYTQDGDQRYEAWLEVDVRYTQGYRLTGNALLSENGAAFGQYTIDDDGDGPPVTERNGSTRAPWTHSNLNGDGSSDGNVLLFPIPAKTDGATVTVSGTLNANMGTTGTVRLLITERD